MTTTPACVKRVTQLSTAQRDRMPSYAQEWINRGLNTKPMDLTAWDVDTIETFAATLGRRLAPVLVGLKALQPLAADEQAAQSVAEKEQG